MIKISPREYHINCTYNEAILYCFSLNIDGYSSWRLPTEEERDGIEGYYGWHLGIMDSLPRNTTIAKCVPVRDIVRDII